MQVVFVSNYFNHHQLSFCDALYELLEGSFCFLQTQPMEEERVKMGWQAEERPYVRYVQPDGTTTGGSEAFTAVTGWTPDEEIADNEWQNLLLTADMVIFGGCDDESYIRERLAAGKPIFRYNERLYKEGQWKAISPRGLLQKYKDHTRYRKAPVYFLCAGAYVPCDLGIIHAYPEKMLRFGYFPETREYAPGEPFSRKKKGSILWAARMIDWKHPELVVKTAAYLKEHLKEIPFHITMIGGGELEEEVHSLAEELGVADRVHFLGNHKNIADYYQTMDYFVYPSRYEGMPGTIVEAQASGLPCLMSDTICREVIATDLVETMSIEKEPKVWAEVLQRRMDALVSKQENREKYAAKMAAAGFDVQAQAERMMRFYESGRWENE